MTNTLLSEPLKHAVHSFLRENFDLQFMTMDITAETEQDHHEVTVKFYDGDNESIESFTFTELHEHVLLTNNRNGSFAGAYYTSPNKRKDAIAW
jgi:hypothetical protein